MLTFMFMERREKIYTLHRYIDNETGAPDLGKIFSREGNSLLRRHLDLGLKKIWRNQPEEVQDIVRQHLDGCEKCKDEFGDKIERPRPGGLPF